MRIPFLNFEPMHSSIKTEMTDAFNTVYDDYWYIMGRQLECFEGQYAQFNDVKYTIGVSNGLDALYISLKALGIGLGDEVIMPSNTFIATAMAVSYTGAKPVFVEPDANTYLINPDLIPSVVTNKTRVIMPVHLYGQACEMSKIIEIADYYALKIIEDNAQAHGASFAGRKTGSFGHINATSFYPGKNLGALGDGGAITTNDEFLYSQALKLRNYGSSHKYVHDIIGHNMRLDELQAAFLSVKLKYLQKWTEERQNIAKQYSEGLEGIGDIVIPSISSGSTHVFHLYVILTKRRDELQHHLSENGIGSLIHYPIPPHLQKAYSHLGYTLGSFPVAESLSQRSLSLPLWIGMSSEHVTQVIDSVRSFYK
jgi:dTDP-4-amino-4,6-dideoxygalactose transaminase